MMIEIYIFMIAILIQWLAFLPAYIYSSEKFFDLVGSLTFLSVIVSSLVFASSLDVGKILISFLVFVWACRLGSFLFIRVNRSNGDSRFDEIKKSAIWFLGVWTLQGIWVIVTSSAAIFAITSQSSRDFGLISYIGLSVWMLGFSIEVIADSQKNSFRNNKNNKNLFIKTGLWSMCRHPNYLGEILLWTGIFCLAYPYLIGWKILSIISPFFVYFLLTYVSGIPLLERVAEKKWGDDPKFILYKKRTNRLLPKIF